MPNPVLAEIIGPDILIVLVVILVLFGGSQLPKLARGSARRSVSSRRGSKKAPTTRTSRNPTRSPTDRPAVGSVGAPAGPGLRASLTA
jgi:Sec-independent protein translocase protein TatA